MPILAIHRFSIQPQTIQYGSNEIQFEFEAQITGSSQNPVEATLSISEDTIQVFLVNDNDEDSRQVSWSETFRAGTNERSFVGYIRLRERLPQPVSVRVTLTLVDQLGNRRFRYTSIICE